MSLLDASKHTTPFSFFVATNKREFLWILLNAASYGVATISMLVTTYILGQVIDSLEQTGTVRFLWLVAIVGTLIVYEYVFRVGHIIEVMTIARMRASVKKALFEH